VTILPTAFAIVHISLRQLYDTEPAMTSGAVALIHFGLAFCPRLYTSFSSFSFFFFFVCVCVSARQLPFPTNLFLYTAPPRSRGMVR
jgi:hypothetical protein